MSEHWEPPRRPWTRADAYVVRGGGSGGRRVPDGAKAGLVLVGAACVGLAFGAYQAFGPREIVASEAAVQPSQRVRESIAPEFSDADVDAEWAARAEGRVSPSTRSGRTAVAGVRASFSYCKWGGGTNCVVDGDTFYIGGQKVRIADIDAPETHDYRCQSELELGERAARDLQALLNSGAVTMTRIDRDRDVYGRMLRNVRVNGRDVGEALISAGVARAYVGGRRPWC
jgi:endonuclease YncB( thermonuclease family)